MSDEIRVNRVSQNPQPTPKMDPMMQSEPMSAQNSSKMPWVILAVVVLVLVVLGILFRARLFKGNSATSPSASTAADTSDYVAVFLTNGQVYFGKLSQADAQYPDLKDIYYLQVGPQQGSGTTGQATSSAASQSISLVKLGNELHGPVDEMHINRDQVLFYEQLKSDGQVVKAIESYKANPNGAPVPTK